MSEWQQTPEGWLAVYPTDELVQWARELRAARDDALRNVYEHGGPDHRWAGHAGELLFSALVRARGHELELRGGPGEPDAIVYGRATVDVKTKGVTGRFRRGWPVVVREPDPDDVIPDAYAFMAHERYDGRFVFLGVAGAATVLRLGRLVKAGEMLAGRVPAAAAAFELDEGQLTPPGVWLRALDEIRARLIA